MTWSLLIAAVAKAFEHILTDCGLIGDTWVPAVADTVFLSISSQTWS
jgi:hypothetical protein